MRAFSRELCLCLLLLAVNGCMPKTTQPAATAAPSGPIAGFAWDRSANMPAIAFDEGPSLAGYWWRFMQEGRALEIGKRPQELPLLAIATAGGGGTFAWDSVTEGYRLAIEGTPEKGFGRFYGLTAGNRQPEPYAAIAIAQPDPGEVLYGLLGKPVPAATAGIQLYNGGYLASRRADSEAVLSGKAQARLEGDARPQRLSLLVTAPAEMPDLFGRRVGTIQLVATYDPASLSFRADGREIEAVGPGAKKRAKVQRFSLLAQAMNGGDSLAGLFRLLDSSGEAVYVGAFSLQTTGRSGPLTSKTVCTAERGRGDCDHLRAFPEG